MDMFAALLQIKNYKLFVANMFLLGMGIGVTVPYLVLFATKDLGMTTNQYGLLLASAAISQFTVNSIIARFSDTHHFNRKIIIILALLMGALGFSIYFFVDTIWLFIYYYMRFSKDYFALSNAPTFTHLLENLSMFQALKIELNLPTQYYVQCSHWAFYLVHLLVPN